MALSGSLRDFDLSYIFQIVAHEGKTGRLTLSDGQGTGAVVFKHGLVISASEKAKDLSAMLSGYLVEMHAGRAKEIRELHKLFGSSLRRLSSEYLTRGYLTHDELSHIVTLGIEDLACSLFLWEEGTYSFEVLTDVQTYQAESIAVAYESVTMEAARRADEFRRMRETISPSTVFIKPENPYVNVLEHVSPFDDLVEYVYGKIDGTSPVDYLCRTPFASDYRIYEALHLLQEEGRIAPLSEKLSRSINAALSRQKRPASGEVQGSDLGLSILATGAVVLAILFIAVILVRGHFMADLITPARRTHDAVPTVWANRNAQTARLWYRSRHVGESPQPAELFADGLLNRNELQWATYSEHDRR